MTDLSQVGPADVTDALREGNMMELVRRFVIDNETPSGATMRYDVECAAALLDRLLELVEGGAI